MNFGEYFTNMPERRLPYEIENLGDVSDISREATLYALRLLKDVTIDILSSPITYARQLKEKHGKLAGGLVTAGIVGAPVAVAVLTSTIIGSFDHRAVMIGGTTWNAECIVFHTLLHPPATI